MKQIKLHLKRWCRTLLCIGLSAFPPAASAAAGDAFAAQRLDLNLSFRNATLREVVTAFTEQTGVSFSYETTLGNRILADVNVESEDASLEETLNAVFRNTGISWKIKDRVVALTALQEAEPATPAQEPPLVADRKPVVTGRVVDERGEPLVGVNVLVKDTTMGVSTGIDGTYSIAVSDDDTLEFSYVGYISVSRRVGTQTRIDVVIEIDAKAYYEYPYSKKPLAAVAVGKINRALKGSGKKILLLAPGRLGTSSPELGVPCSFADISGFAGVCVAETESLQEGQEFPGRMRDQVAKACKVSAPKLARLKVIREKLKAYSYRDEQIEVVNATEIIEMAEPEPSSVHSFFAFLSELWMMRAFAAVRIFPVDL